MGRFPSGRRLHYAGRMHTISEEVTDVCVEDEDENVVV